MVQPVCSLQKTGVWSTATIAFLAAACVEPPTPKGAIKPREKPPAMMGDVPFLQAMRTSTPIVIDGALGEEAWSRAYSTPPFVEPNRGLPANPAMGLGGRAWVLFDDDYLYLGIRAEDPNPQSPFAPTDLDPHIWEEASGVGLVIQPGDPGDNVHYFQIEIDPRGAVFDSQWADYNTPILATSPVTFGYQAWSSQVYRMTTVVAHKGYFVEMAIPWSAFPSRPNVRIPPRPGDVWRMNFYVFTAGMRQSVAWSPILGQGNYHRVSRFGRVQFGGR